MWDSFPHFKLIYSRSNHKTFCTSLANHCFLRMKMFRCKVSKTFSVVLGSNPSNNSLSTNHSNKISVKNHPHRARNLKVFLCQIVYPSKWICSRIFSNSSNNSFSRNWSSDTLSSRLVPSPSKVCLAQFSLHQWAKMEWIQWWACHLLLDHQTLWWVEDYLWGCHRRYHPNLSWINLSLVKVYLLVALSKETRSTNRDKSTKGESTPTFST